MTEEHRMASKPMLSLDGFLTANSVLTPAVAGTGVTTITAMLVSQFGLPGDWSVLALSMIFGLLTWADKTVPWLKRLALYLINTTTILVFAIGLNSAGMAASGYDDCPVKRIYDRVSDTRPKEFFQPWLRSTFHGTGGER